MDYIIDAYGIASAGKPQGLDLEKFEQLTKKAQEGDATAQFRLACCYFNGWETKTSRRKAFDLWAEAAAKGHVFATHKLGNCYAFKWHVKERDYAKASEYWLKGASLGAPMSMHNLGWYNNYIVKDFDKAIEWYTASANLGYLHSMHALGYLYSQKSKKYDLQKAGEWLAKAVENGSKWAEQRLARIIYGTPKKMKTTKAAQPENPDNESNDEE